MELSLLSLLSFGFVLGIKHSIEPDHVIAVSTIASRDRTWWRSSLTGVFWGIGHTATLFIVGMMILLLKGEIHENWTVFFEFSVGMMLILLGVNTFYIRERVEGQEEKPKGMPYKKSLLIGLVHGLAGSAAMVLLVMTTVQSVWQAAAYILIFGVGTIIGMLFFTTIISIPFVLSVKRIHLNRILMRSTGVISVLYGCYYLFDMVI
jgi:sulfite exporter TauE/SafE